MSATFQHLMLYMTRGLGPIHMLVNTGDGRNWSSASTVSTLPTHPNYTRYARDHAQRIRDHTESLMHNEVMSVPEATGDIVLHWDDLLATPATLVQFRLAILQFYASSSPTSPVRLIHFFKWDGTSRSREDIVAAFSMYPPDTMDHFWKQALGPEQAWMATVSIVQELLHDERIYLVDAMPYYSISPSNTNLLKHCGVSPEGISPLMAIITGLKGLWWSVRHHLSKSVDRYAYITRQELTDYLGIRDDHIQDRRESVMEILHNIHEYVHLHGNDLPVIDNKHAKTMRRLARWYLGQENEMQLGTEIEPKQGTLLNFLAVVGFPSPLLVVDGTYKEPPDCKEHYGKYKALEDVVFVDPNLSTYVYDFTRIPQFLTGAVKKKLEDALRCRYKHTTSCVRVDPAQNPYRQMPVLLRDIHDVALVLCDALNGVPYRPLTKREKRARRPVQKAPPLPDVVASGLLRSDAQSTPNELHQQDLLTRQLQQQQQEELERLDRVEEDLALEDAITESELERGEMQRQMSSHPSPPPNMPPDQAELLATINAELDQIRVQIDGDYTLISVYLLRSHHLRILQEQLYRGEHVDPSSVGTPSKVATELTDQEYVNARLAVVYADQTVLQDAEFPSKVKEVRHLIDEHVWDTNKLLENRRLQQDLKNRHTREFWAALLEERAMMREVKSWGLALTYSDLAIYSKLYNEKLHAQNRLLHRLQNARTNARSGEAKKIELEIKELNKEVARLETMSDHTDLINEQRRLITRLENTVVSVHRTIQVYDHVIKEMAQLAGENRRTWATPIVDFIRWVFK